ncbi:MAG TPA: hypothetical protein IAD07_04195 [Candidatus Fimivicinus intestinavium]|nr:hypothetical protein [Candidatus Fimivicinus intestinavium]
MRNSLISETELCDYLGVDEESYSLVSRMRDAAMDDLRRSAGFTECSITDFGLVNEYVMCSVYLSFYATRGESQNTQYVECRRNQILKKLQYAPEGSDTVKRRRRSK